MFEIYNNYIIPPIAAGVATIPTYFPLETKTALQLGLKPRPFCFGKSLFEGLKAAPTMGSVIGAQLSAQKLLENQLNETPTIQDIALSSIVVGGASTPFWAILNGQTMGWSSKKSLKELTFKQTNAIIIREAIFLFSLKVSTPLNKTLKDRFGESKLVEYGTIFSTMAIGSFLSHPADTLLTLSQAGKPIEVKKLMKGSGITAIALGVFGVLNHFFEENLQMKTQ
jgi:hypothetical protein